MNQYLEKIASFEKQALRRIITELAKGKVSTGLDKLVQLGAVKSKKIYSRGTKLGNDNIAKQLKTTINRPRTKADLEKAQSGKGYITMPGRDRDLIFSDRRNSELFPTRHDHNHMVRHELFEAMEARAAGKAGKIGRTKDGKIGLPATVFTKEIEPGVHKSVGLHFSPRVLARESELVRKNPHIARNFKRIRGESGEADTIQRLTGKKYGVDKMTSKDYHKAHTANPDAIIDYHGIPTAAFKHNPEATKKQGIAARLAAEFKKRFGYE